MVVLSEVVGAESGPKVEIKVEETLIPQSVEDDAGVKREATMEV